jgi:7-carboxy-7-deazaguanine synthase
MELIVNEIFTSVQGEGIHTGLATTFVRLAGCDLRCRWCDTPHALELEDGKSMSFGEIVKGIRKGGTDLVCITGGEPLYQKNTSLLVRELIESGFRVDVETNGANDVSVLPLEGESLFLSVDVKPPSSNESDGFFFSNLDHMRDGDQLKFIIKEEADLDFTMDFLKKQLPPCNIILTPCSNENGSEVAERLIMEAGNCEGGPFGEVLKKTRVMIQTHKVLWDPDRRGI